jgi:hypothetical protein
VNYDILADLVLDKRKYIENLVSIVDRDRNVVPFTFNKAQDNYWNKKTKRDIILKAGQLGFTSVIDAEFLIDCMTVPGTVSVVVAHEEFITQRLLNRVKFFESTIPEEFPKPKLHHQSAYELTWPEINSTFYIGSARAYVFGRGERITNFHASELAFWHDPDRIMIPITQRADRIVLESTPWGEGTYYHQKTMEALGGNSVWTLHFYPWWWGEHNILLPDDLLSLPRDRQTPLNYTDEEQQLIKMHNLNEGQIRWRRAKLNELGDNFYAEHPEDVDTCFFTSEEMVYSKDILDSLVKQCYSAPHTHSSGAEIWYPPEENGLYIIGADPTVGVTDDAAAIVWNIANPQPVHCATLTGLLQPEVFSQRLKELGYYYYNACLAVESNNPGVAVLIGLKDYPNLYYRHNVMTGAEMNQVGWLTTEATKSFMINEFRKLLPEIITHDIRLVRQARNLRFYGMKIISTGEDDIHDAAAIGLAVRYTLPTTSPRGLVGSYGWKW